MIMGEIDFGKADYSDFVVKSIYMYSKFIREKK